MQILEGALRVWKRHSFGTRRDNVLEIRFVQVEKSWLFDLCAIAGLVSLRPASRRAARQALIRALVSNCSLIPLVCVLWPFPGIPQEFHRRGRGPRPERSRHGAVQTLPGCRIACS